MCYNKAMKTWLTICIVLLFISSVFADETYVRRYNGYPQGTFKMSRNGSIIQYDKQGKKVGVYKTNQKRYKKIK